MAEETELWNDKDPDFLNNHEKLLKLKWTKDGLNSTASSSFYQSFEIVTELILQDTRINEIILKLQSYLVTEQNGIGVLSRLDEKLLEDKETCNKIIKVVQNKLIRGDVSIRSTVQERNIQNWVDALENFGKTFEKAKSLRLSRKSILPSAEIANQDETVKLVSKLGKILQELDKLSQII